MSQKSQQPHTKIEITIPQHTPTQWFPHSFIPFIAPSQSASFYATPATLIPTEQFDMENPQKSLNSNFDPNNLPSDEIDRLNQTAGHPLDFYTEVQPSTELLVEQKSSFFHKIPAIEDVELLNNYNQLPIDAQISLLVDDFNDELDEQIYQNELWFNLHPYSSVVTTPNGGNTNALHHSNTLVPQPEKCTNLKPVRDTFLQWEEENKISLPQIDKKEDLSAQNDKNNQNNQNLAVQNEKDDSKKTKLKRQKGTDSAPKSTTTTRSAAAAVKSQSQFDNDMNNIDISQKGNFIIDNSLSKKKKTTPYMPPNPATTTSNYYYHGVNQLEHLLRPVNPQVYTMAMLDDYWTLGYCRLLQPDKLSSREQEKKLISSIEHLGVSHVKQLFDSIQYYLAYSRVETAKCYDIIAKRIKNIHLLKLARFNIYNRIPQRRRLFHALAKGKNLSKVKKLNGNGNVEGVKRVIKGSNNDMISMNTSKIDNNIDQNHKIIAITKGNGTEKMIIAVKKDAKDEQQSLILSGAVRVTPIKSTNSTTKGTLGKTSSLQQDTVKNTKAKVGVKGVKGRKSTTQNIQKNTPSAQKTTPLKIDENNENVPKIPPNKKIQIDEKFNNNNFDNINYDEYDHNPNNWIELTTLPINSPQRPSYTKPFTNVTYTIPQTSTNTTRKGNNDTNNNTTTVFTVKPPALKYSSTRKIDRFGGNISPLELLYMNIVGADPQPPNNMVSSFNPLRLPPDRINPFISQLPTFNNINPALLPSDVSLPIQDDNGNNYILVGEHSHPALQNHQLFVDDHHIYPYNHDLIASITRDDDDNGDDDDGGFVVQHYSLVRDGGHGNKDKDNNLSALLPPAIKDTTYSSSGREYKPLLDDVDRFKHDLYRPGNYKTVKVQNRSNKENPYNSTARSFSRISTNVTNQVMSAAAVITKEFCQQQGMPYRRPNPDNNNNNKKLSFLDRNDIEPPANMNQNNNMNDNTSNNNNNIGFDNDNGKNMHNNDDNTMVIDDIDSISRPSRGQRTTTTSKSKVSVATKPPGGQRGPRITATAAIAAQGAIADEGNPRGDTKTRGTRSTRASTTRASSTRQVNSNTMNDSSDHDEVKDVDNKNQSIGVFASTLTRTTGRVRSASRNDGDESIGMVVDREDDGVAVDSAVGVVGIDDTQRPHTGRSQRRQSTSTTTPIKTIPVVKVDDEGDDTQGEKVKVGPGRRSTLAKTPAKTGRGATAKDTAKANVVVKDIDGSDGVGQVDSDLNGVTVQRGGKTISRKLESALVDTNTTAVSTDGAATRRSTRSAQNNEQSGATQQVARRSTRRSVAKE